MAAQTPYSPYSTDYRIGGRMATPTRAPEALPWRRGIALGLMLALMVIAGAFVVVRVALAAPVGAAARVRLDIVQLRAEDVTGRFGLRDQVVLVYTLRTAGGERVERRGAVTLSAGARTVAMPPQFLALMFDAPRDSLIYLTIHIYAVDPDRPVLDPLRGDLAQAVASGDSVLVGCVTDTLYPAEVDAILRGSGSYTYGPIVPGVCAPEGAAWTMTDTPYRITYRISAEGL